jgi:hypothetical protein
MRAEHAGLLTEAVLASCMGAPRARRASRARGLADGYEAVKRRAERGGRESGTWFTPPGTVGSLLDACMPRTLPARWTLCDPACGTGHVLAGAAARLAARGWAPARIARALRGMDIDPLAVAIARVRLALAFGGGVAAWSRAVRCGDALAAGAWDGLEFGAVAGNPPFLGQLARSSARTPAERAARAGRFGGSVRRYADEASAFLALACELAPRGRVAMVQPLAALSTADGQPVRERCESTHALRSVEVLGARTFGADVRTCIVGLDGGRRAARVRVRAEDGTAIGLAAGRAAGGRWGAALAAARGVPDPGPSAGRATLASIADATSDFRQHYYGLRGKVREAPARGAGRGERMLVTAGTIGVAACAWGAAPATIHGRTFARPSVRASDLARDRVLGPWARARAGRKVLVAPQKPVLAAWVDDRGRALPSVPVVTVRPHRARDAWLVGAAILAPPVAAEAWWRHAGSGLSAGALRVSARQLLGLPLPADRAAWRRGAALLARWQRTPSAAAARAFAETMCRAHGVTGADARAVGGWWLRTARLDAR